MSTSETFAVRIDAGGGFGPVTAALARKLSWLGEQLDEHCVILEVPGRPWTYYVQAAIDPAEGAWVEAVSNQFIEEPSARLDAGQLATLADLGFRPPGESPNHQLRLLAPLDWTELAALFVVTLTTVYGVTEHDEVELRIFPLVQTTESP